MSKLALILLLCQSTLWAAPPSSKPSAPSSRPSSPPPSSRPSSPPPSSRPSSPPPSSRPSSPPPSSRPSSPPPSSRPSSPPPSSRPSSPPPSSRPLAGSGFQKPETQKPKLNPSIDSNPKPSERPQAKPISPETVKPDAGFSNPSASTKPSSRPSQPDSGFNNPNKPKQSFDNAASSAQKRVESKDKFVNTSKPKIQQSTPKESYKTPSGQTIKVDSNSPSVKTVRSIPSEKYEQRPTRVEHHYHHTYGDRYGYYRSQPYVYVGGGYSPLFWYAMMDWDYHRRAEWLYHNQHLVNQSLYAEQLQNAQLRAEIDRLRAENIPINHNYVDPEFKDNQDLMYSDDFVDAAYNPTTTSNNFAFWVIAWIAISSLVGLGIYFVFFYNFKDKE